MLISLLWWCIIIIIINNNHHHYHHHHHCSSLLTPALRVWFPSLPALTSVSARAYFLQPFLLLDLNLIIIECRCLAVGLKLACSKHFFFPSSLSSLGYRENTDLVDAQSGLSLSTALACLNQAFSVSTSDRTSLSATEPGLQHQPDYCQPGVEPTGWHGRPQWCQLQGYMQKL